MCPPLGGSHSKPIVAGYFGHLPHSLFPLLPDFGIVLPDLLAVRSDHSNRYINSTLLNHHAQKISLGERELISVGFLGGQFSFDRPALLEYLHCLSLLRLLVGRRLQSEGSSQECIINGGLSDSGNGKFKQ